MPMRLFQQTMIAAGLALATPVAGAQAFDVSLQPTTVEIPAEAGDRTRQAFTISNDNDEDSVGVTIGLADWTLSRGGDLDLLPPGSDQRSAATWISFSPVFVDLAPGESRRILVDIAVPPALETPGTYRTALIASSISPDTRPGAAGMLRKHEIASLFYLTTPDAESQPVIRAIETNPSRSFSELSIRVDNDGNAHARLEGEINVERPSHPSLTIPVSNLVILENSSRTFRVPVTEPIPDGSTATARFRNIFAPQASGGSAPVTAYSASLYGSGDASARP